MSSRCITTFVVALAGFLMPPELLCSFFANSISNRVLGGFIAQNYFLFQPQILFSAFIISFFIFSKCKIRYDLFWIGCLFSSIGLAEVWVTYYFAGQINLAFRQFIFGFLYPSLIIVFIGSLTSSMKSVFFRWFYLGYFFYIITILTVLFCERGMIAKLVNAYNVGGALIAFRYQHEGSRFFGILSCVNNQANMLLMAMMLGGGVLFTIKQSFAFLKSNRSISIASAQCFSSPIFNPELLKICSTIRAYRAFSLVALLLLLLLFSRATLFLLPFVLYVNRSLLFSNYKRLALIILSVSIVITLLDFRAIEHILKYFLFTQYVDGSSNGFWGTFNWRFHEWGKVWSFLKQDFAWLHGIGVEKWRQLDGNQAHNLFLDHFLNGGLYAPAILFSLITFGLFKAVKNGRTVGFWGFLIFIMLSFREYSFSNLYVTSMGGFLFLLLFYVVLENPSKMSPPQERP